MAECYKITQQQPPGGAGGRGAGGGQEVAQSITYLKYKHLKQVGSRVSASRFRV